MNVQNMVVKIFEKTTRKSYLICLIIALTLVTIPNVNGAHYYQLQLFFENGELIGTNVSLKKSPEVPTLRHSGPYNLEMVTKGGKIVGEKSFDVREKISIEKRLRSDEWENIRRSVKSPSTLINIPYNSSISKIVIKKDSAKLGEIKVKKEMKFTIRTCKEMDCGGGEKKKFVKNESIWILYQSDTDNLETNTLITFPDNHTEKIDIPRKIIPKEGGKYRIKSSASKIGYENMSSVTEIEVGEGNINTLNIIIGIVLILVMLVGMMLLKKYN